VRDPDRRFDWIAVPGLAGRLGPDELRRFDDKGYVVVRDAFSRQEIDAVTAAIDPHEHAAEEFLRTQPEGRYFIARADEITFTTHLVMRSELLRDFSRSALIADLCGDLLGPDVRLYWDQSVYKKPNTEAEFPFHQDNGYTDVDPQQYLTCWIPLTDTDETNGCPWVMPGLHRMGTLAHEYTDLGWKCLDSTEEAVAVPASAGDIVLFSSLTPHRTGPNLTGETRKTYILQYAPEGIVKIDKGLRLSQQDPDRQFPVLVDGARVAG